MSAIKKYNTRKKLAKKLLPHLACDAVSLLFGNEIKIPMSDSGKRLIIGKDLIKKLLNADDLSVPAVLITLRGK